MASTRLNFVLDGRDALSGVLDRVGDNANRLHRRVSSATTNMSTSFNRLTQSATRDGNALTRLFQRNGTAVARYTTDADGRLRDLRGRYLSAAQATRVLAGDTSGLPDALSDATDSMDGAAKAGGKLGPVMGGVGAALGLSLLPAIGAVAPMAAGAGLALGTLKMGFSGVGEAAALAGEDKKEYAKALKKLSPEARTFTKELVKTKDQFGAFKEKVQAAMLPGFTKALKEAKPVVDIVGKGMTSMGKGFGDAAAGAGKLFKSGGFQRDLKTNLDLGKSFVGEMTGGLGALGRSFLEFGAKSGPTLRSFSGGLSGLLGKGGGGLAGMFKGLEPGIDGSAKLLDGLFGAVNRILPALGRLGGMAGKAFGPLFGELFRFSGKATSALMDGLGLAIKWLSPAFKDLSFGVKSLTDVLTIIAPTVRDAVGAIFGSFMPAFSEVDKARGPLQKLSDTIKENKGAIQEFARQASTGMISFAGAIIENLPGALGVFRMVTGGMVSAMGGVLHGAAKAFGWIPGIGDKLKAADRHFASFKDSYISGLKTAEAKTRQFAAEALPKLEQGKLKMNITNWNSQIETAKGKLKTVPPEKRAALRAEIGDLQRKAAQARAELASVQSKVVTITTRHVVTSTGEAKRPGKVGHYASGGRPSPGEVAWVGEEGPELVRFGSGGPQVYSHRQSMAMISDAASAGRDAGLGLQRGMGVATGEVEASGRALAGAILYGVRDELEIASPSKKMKALMKDVGRGLILGMTGEKSKISATAKDLVKDIWAAWKGVKTNKDSALVARVTKDTKKLQTLATARDKLAARIKAATEYRATLTSGAQQAAGLSSLGLQDEEVSASSIQAGLSQKLAKVAQFARYVAGLAKRGLSKSLLRQVLDMGPDQGYAYASALSGMGTSALRAVNTTQSHLDKAASNLGALGADVMYDSGKNASKGYLKGLDSQQAAIEKQMVKIAKSMDKAIRKALGIKSPSTVAAVSGGFFTRGVAKGAVDELPFLDRAMGAVAGRMAGMRPVIGRPAFAGGGAGGGPVIHANITVQTLDPAAGAREVEKLLLKLARSRGGTVTLKVG
ncbi:hypothetical protein ACFCXC_14780 [Streptomyces microflavus]|uniref:hypothetical protein n=1 Tax=Streptomyces microflavus TaxID=1919 RepID=UPI0035D88DBE